MTHWPDVAGSQLYLRLTDLTAPLWNFFHSLQGDQVEHYAVFYNYLLAIELTLHYGRQIGVGTSKRHELCI